VDMKSVTQKGALRAKALPTSPPVPPNEVTVTCVSSPPRKWYSVMAAGAIALLLFGAGVLVGQRAVLGVKSPPPQTTVVPDTRSSPDPIFQCTGAGVGAVVSLGGDGSSVYVYCTKDKS